MLNRVLSWLLFGVVGFGVGLMIQLVRSAGGHAPMVPPLSLSFSMIVLAGVLLWLAIALRRAVTRASSKPVNPFHAVRLLAGARAAQLSGMLFAGFGGGLLAQLLGRSVAAPASSWVPMILVAACGLVLAVCGYISEQLCRVPPTDSDDESDPDGQAEPEAV